MPSNRKKYTVNSRDGDPINRHGTVIVDGPQQIGRPTHQRENTVLLRNIRPLDESDHALGDRTVSSVSSTYPSKDGGQSVEVIAARVGIYGWRKYCLYLSLLLIVALSIMNMGLMVWMIRTLEMKEGAAGPLHFNDQQLLVQGRADFVGGLSAQLFEAADAPLVMQSTENVTLRAGALDAGSAASTMILSEESVSVDTPSFRVGSGDNTFLSADEDAVVITANQMRVSAGSGMTVDGSVQTSRLTNAAGDGLTLSSPGRSLNIVAEQELTLRSEDESLTLSALLGIDINAQAGITLSGGDVHIPNLPEPAADVAYGLCVCADSGKLFRVPAATLCSDAAGALCV